MTRKEEKMIVRRIRGWKGGGKDIKENKRARKENKRLTKRKRG